LASIHEAASIAVDRFYVVLWSESNGLLEKRPGILFDPQRRQGVGIVDQDQIMPSLIAYGSGLEEGIEDRTEPIQIAQRCEKFRHLPRVPDVSTFHGKRRRSNVCIRGAPSDLDILRAVKAGPEGFACRGMGLGVSRVLFCP
jgi:hypothetical protein